MDDMNVIANCYVRIKKRFLKIEESFYKERYKNNLKPSFILV